MNLTRRQSIAGLAALPVVAAFGGFATRGFAQDAPSFTAAARSFALGDLKVTTLLAASRPVPDPHTIFGLNVDDATFAQVSADNFIPTDMAQFYFTPTLVQTGAETILFDTGTDAPGVTAALAQAGFAPADISHVVLTHMHPDHIGGLSDDAGTPTFSNAAYITGQTEFDYWAGQANEVFEAKMRPLADKTRFIGDGGAVASGITGMAAFGHSPGHMAYMLDSGGKQLILLADTANHYVWSLAYPDWEVRFDADKAAAAATRRILLGMAATDKMAVIGYHMPFPAAGFIETRGDGYNFVPVSYQMM